MKNILTITYYTIREALSRKIFIAFFGISSLVLLVIMAVFAATSLETLSNIQMDGKGTEGVLLQHLAVFFKTIIVMPLFGGGLFLSIFSSSSFVPNMLEKGNIDLILSKPISRGQIIQGKFWGGVCVVLFNIAYLVIGLWLLIGLKFGVWDTELFITIASITFTFAVLYSLMILVGIATRSSVLAMMLSYLIFFINRKFIFEVTTGKLFGSACDFLQRNINHFCKDNQNHRGKHEYDAECDVGNIQQPIARVFY